MLKIICVFLILFVVIIEEDILMTWGKVVKLCFKENRFKENISLDEAFNRIAAEGKKMMTTEGLKLCPFCGYEADMQFDIRNRVYEIRCSNESCIANSLNRPYKTKSKAINAWNMRINNVG